MKRVILHSISVITLVALWSCGTQGTRFYVDPTAEPGGIGTASAPFATIQEAVDGVRAAREAGEIKTGKPVEVIFRAGEYILETGVKLTSMDSGTADSPVVWKADKGAVVRVSGGIPVPAGLFRPVEDPSVIAKLPEEGRGKVYVADLSGIYPYETAQLAPSFGATPVAPIVFTGGAIGTLARWPNEGYVDFDKVIDHGGENGSFGAFVCDDPRPARWDYDAGVWLNGYWSADWSNSSGRAAGFGTEKGVKNVLRLAANVGKVKGGTWGRDPRRFYAFNMLEELDAPGEWFLDREKKLLYLVPLGGTPSDEDGTMLARISEPLVRADDISFFEIRGIDFGYSYGDALYLKGDDICISDCTFSCFGGTAISLSGDRNTAKNLEINQIGRSGINMNGGDLKTLTKAESIVEDCDIHHYGIYQRCYAPAVGVQGCGITLRHNKMHDAPHNAVLYGGNEHLFEYNEVYNVTFETADAGAYYTGRDWTTQGNVLRYNYTHDMRSGMEYESNTIGFYFDDLDCGDEVYGNVFQNVCQGIMIGGGREHPLYNNVFVNCEIAITLDARGLRWPTYASFDEGTGANELVKKAEAFDYKNGIWAEKYPRLAKIMDEEPLVPLYDPIHDNVFIDCTRFIIDLDTATYSHLNRMAPINDNIVINTLGTEGRETAVINENIKDGFTVFDGTLEKPFNPGFTDPANGNFSLRKDAWIRKQLPGFKDIPTIK